MNPDVIYNALASLISLAIGCYLYFWRFRSYRIDRFRLEMFQLRDELFDEADDGLIDFDHPAYGMLRSMMNGYIRFAGRLNLWLIIALVSLTAGLDVPTEESWLKTTSTLDPVVRDRLNAYRDRMGHLAMKHAMIVAPEAHVVGLPLLIVAIITLALRHRTLSGGGTSSPYQQTRSTVAATIDDTAFAYGQGELLPV